VPSFDPEAMFKVMEAERCTFLSGVPTSYLVMLDHPARQDYDLSSLKAGSRGGADCNPDVLRRCAEELNLNAAYLSALFSRAFGIPFKSYLTTQKDTTVSYSGVFQTAGTGTENALITGQYGTLIIGPEGTAAAKRKYTLPAFSQGCKFNIAYANVVELACDFQGNGTATYGTF